MSFETPNYYSNPPRYGRPKLVTAVGIIGIIWASLSLLGGLCGLATNAAQMQFGERNEALERLMQEPAYQAVTWVGGILGLGIAGLLMAGSIWLLGRQPKARGVLTAYAWLAIVVQGVVHSVVNIVYIVPRTMEATMAGIRAKGPMPPGMENVMTMSMWVGGCFGLALVLALPIVILVVINRAAVKEWLAGGAGEVGGVANYPAGPTDPFGPG